MPNEINVSLNMQVKNGPYSDYVQPGQIQIDQAAIGREGVVHTVGTSVTTIYSSGGGDITTEGLVYLRNLDDTNYCTFGPWSGSSQTTIGKLKPGEYCFFRMDPAISTLRATADTAAIELDVRIFSD